MRSRANLPVFIAYALLGLLATAFLAAQMGGEFVLGGYRVNAIFKTGAELVAGDDVTMSGLRVGKVESMTPVDGATQVTLLLHRDFTPVFKDARAIIRQKNLLGEAYVEVNQVHNALDPQVRDQLNLVINSLGQATAGRGQDMNASAADLSAVALNLKV